VKVLGVADSDSYVKWGATILDRMPDSWQRSLAVIRTPALPSRGQLASALSGSQFTVSETAVLDLADLARIVANEKPDVVLLSVRGPVVRVLVRMIVASSQVRPVIVSGLPGISIPETLNALYYRSQVDYFLLHSKREVRAFSALAEQLGIEQEFGLATLPFLLPRHPDAKLGTDIVFAPQAKVPRHLHSRKRMLGWLVDTARNNPDRRVVIKLRGVAGEAQTHAEHHPYDVMLAQLHDAPDNLIVSTGSMSKHLADAGALVTVSSTATLEAIAAGVPVLAIDEFGVNGPLINIVFEDSGLLGDSDALIGADFRHPNEHWLDDNYFHGPSDENWVAGIESAVARRAAGELPLRPQFRASVGGDLRRVWDRKRALGSYDRSPLGYFALAIGTPLRSLVRTYHRVRPKAQPGPQASAEDLARVP
jgi:hypothetical protein